MKNRFLFSKNRFFCFEKPVFCFEKPVFQNKKPEYVFEINVDDKSESTFPMKDIFAKTACMFLKGVKIESLGTQIESFMIKRTTILTSL